MNAIARLQTLESVIDDVHWLCNQTWTRRRIVSQGQFRLRYTISRNAYASQSDATAEVWDEQGLRWNVVYTIPGVLMATDASYTAKSVPIEAFDTDLEKLQVVANAII